MSHDQCAIMLIIEVRWPLPPVAGISATLKVDVSYRCGLQLGRELRDTKIFSRETCLTMIRLTAGI